MGWIPEVPFLFFYFFYYYKPTSIVLSASQIHVFLGELRICISFCFGYGFVNQNEEVCVEQGVADVDSQRLTHDDEMSVSI